MQTLSASYTQAFNGRHGRDGALFRGRFNSVVIEDTAQLVQTSLYVHSNPTRAALTADPAAWPWSSAAAFVGNTVPPEWLACGLVLDILGGPDPKAEYRRLLLGR